jgi:L-lactate dehydrogenase complex protein LldG
MNSREQIISAIRKNKPVPSPLPEFQLHFSPDENVFLSYLVALDKCGGKFTFLDSTESISDFVVRNFPETKSICSLVPEIQGDVDVERVYDPHWLKEVDSVVLKGTVGVAENAAVWFPERSLVHRVLPFIAKHLIVILNKADIVANMHEAYHKIKADDYGYGVFIAGPSKTADIGRELVSGVHGVKTFDVIFVE